MVTSTETRRLYATGSCLFIYYKPLQHFIWFPYTFSHHNLPASYTHSRLNYSLAKSSEHIEHVSSYCQVEQQQQQTNLVISYAQPPARPFTRTIADGQHSTYCGGYNVTFVFNELLFLSLLWYGEHSAAREHRERLPRLMYGGMSRQLSSSPGQQSQAGPLFARRYTSPLSNNKSSSTTIVRIIFHEQLTAAGGRRLVHLYRRWDKRTGLLDFGSSGNPSVLEAVEVVVCTHAINRSVAAGANHWKEKKKNSPLVCGSSMDWRM